MKKKEIFHSVCFIGGGSFGSTIANLVAENDNKVMLYVRNTNIFNFLKKTGNHPTLKDLKINPNIEISQDLNSVIKRADIIVFAIPSTAFRMEVNNLKLLNILKPNQIIISVTKGIEYGTFMFMSDILAKILPSNDIGIITGPNIARELCKKSVSASVVASKKKRVRDACITMFSRPYFKIFPQRDLHSAELAGALKNIYAIMAGILYSMSDSHNTKALLITGALSEMSKFAIKLKMRSRGLLGLSGIGDLLATCYSPDSRNFKLGVSLGKGQSIDEAKANLDGAVAEGLNTLLSVKIKMEELNLSLPIIEALYAIIYEKALLKDELSKIIGFKIKTGLLFEKDTLNKE